MARNRRIGTCIALAVLSPLLFTAPAGAGDSHPRKPAVLHGITGSATRTMSTLDLDLEASLSLVQAAAAEASALGAYYDFTQSEYVVVTPSEGPGSELTAEGFADLGLPLRVEQIGFSQTQITAVTGDIAGRTWHPNANDYSYASFFDLETGKTMLDSDAPPEVMAPLLEQYPGAIDYRQTPVQQNSRESDPIPHWGGSALVKRSSWDQNHSAPLECTSAFGVKTHNTHSTPGTDLTNNWMLTAGHCGNLDVDDREIYNWNRNPLSVGSYGSVFYKAPDTETDMELLGIQDITTAWDGVIYDGDGLSENGILVGPTSMARDPVSSVRNYCYSGAASFQNCDLRLQTNFAQYCKEGAPCIENLSAYRPINIDAPAPTLDGDSGAPMYVRTECQEDGSFWPCAALRGMHVASSGRFVLAVKWTKIAAGGPFQGVDGNTYTFDFITPLSVFNPPA